MELRWLADRVRAAMVDDPTFERLSFSSLALAWEGFHKGVDFPLDLRVYNISIMDSKGRSLISAPDAHLTFSLAGLLRGRIVPRTIEVDHGRIVVTRDLSGSLNLGWERAKNRATSSQSFDLRTLLAQLGHPASTDHGRISGLLDQLRHARFLNTEVRFRDRISGLTGRTANMALDLVRADDGRIQGTAQAPLLLGSEQALVTASMDFVPRAQSRMEFRMTSIRPAVIAAWRHELAFLNNVDIPVSVVATAAFDAALHPGRIHLAVRLGEGTIRIAQGAIPIQGGSIALSGTMDRILITEGHLDLLQASGDTPETVDVNGTVARKADRVIAALSVGLDGFDVADLSRLWPVGLGGGARAWVTQHVNGGMVTHGSASLVIEADEALNEVVLTKAKGELDGSNISFTWLDNMPPVERAEVHLRLADPDTLDIHLTNGRQRISNQRADLLIEDGKLRITGLSSDNQVAMIRTQVEGPLTSVLALLAEPRLHLLSEHPISLNPSHGEASGVLDVQLPLEQKLQLADLQIHADGHLTRVRLPDIAGGQNLDDGSFDLSVDKDGLSLKGHGTVAAVPVTLEGTMDFDSGAPDQIVQKIAVAGRPEAAQLDAAGLHVSDLVNGPISMTAVMIERRNGEGSVAMAADLTATTLKFDPLAWTKPSGVPASAGATLSMSHDRLTKIDGIAVRGEGLLLTGLAKCVDGRIRSMTLDTIRLGRTQAHGTIQVSSNHQIDIALRGAQIDLSSALTKKSGRSDAGNGAPSTTPKWSLEARFDQAILANRVAATGIRATATGAGGLVGFLDVSGAGFSAKIEPVAGTRHLLVVATDAGRFLRGIDAIRDLRSGRLTIDGTFRSPLGFHPLTGTMVINDSIVRSSPVLGKLLQAITLYGLVDVLRGPGMRFSHIVAPFLYDGVILELNDARAANSSLGLTAKGRVGLSSGQMSITGTIVPAYFFNALLGHLPFVGKLFSPEKGGGVFAARFGLNGSIDDPSISINPISALTPGFLREIFGIFDDPGAVSRPLDLETKPPESSPANLPSRH